MASTPSQGVGRQILSLDTIFPLLPCASATCIQFYPLLLTKFVKRMPLLSGWLEMLSLHTFVVLVFPSCQAASIQQAGNWSRTLRVNLASPAADNKSTFFPKHTSPSCTEGKRHREEWT